MTTREPERQSPAAWDAKGWRCHLNGTLMPCVGTGERMHADCRFPGCECPAASPPAPSVGDVVREWERATSKLWTEGREAELEEIGDRMAAALTAQAAEVERLTGEIANAHGYLCRNVLQYVAPNVEPFAELRLLCTQIDNGVYGFREDLVKAALRANAAESKVGQAYQVIGALAERAGLFENPDVQRALDYFSGDTFADDFLPWALKEKETK